jgi:hypothetical protein
VNVSPGATSMQSPLIGHWRYNAFMERALLDRFRDRWVGLDRDGKVVADAEALDVLLDKLDASGIVGATVQRIPAVDEPFFVGLR